MTFAALPSASSSVRRLRIGLGTFIAIEAHAATADAALAALESAFAAVAAVEAAMHPQRSGSTLARVNAAPPGVRIGIDAGTHRLLRLARRLNALTCGVFDPCVPCKPGCLADIELGPVGSGDDAPLAPWVVCRAPLALDFGGIAKGHAIDCAVEALVAGGCSAGLVNAGGDVRLFGARRETLLLRGAHGQCRPLTLADTALAVSDVDAAQHPCEHRGYYVRGTGSGARRRYAAVVAPTAVIADALTKCLLLCAEPVARRALAEFGARCAA